MAQRHMPRPNPQLSSPRSNGPRNPQPRLPAALDVDLGIGPAQPPGAPNALANASFAAKRAAREATPRRSPLGSNNSLSRNSRSAIPGVRSNDARNRSISATSIPTPMMLIRGLYDPPEEVKQLRRLVLLAVLLISQRSGPLRSSPRNLRVLGEHGMRSPCRGARKRSGDGCQLAPHVLAPIAESGQRLPAPKVRARPAQREPPARATLTFPAGAFTPFIEALKSPYSTVTDFARFRG